MMKTMTLCSLVLFFFVSCAPEPARVSVQRSMLTDGALEDVEILVDGERSRFHAVTKIHGPLVVTGAFTDAHRPSTLPYRVRAATFDVGVKLPAKGEGFHVTSEVSNGLFAFSVDVPEHIDNSSMFSWSGKGAELDKVFREACGQRVNIKAEATIELQSMSDPLWTYEGPKTAPIKAEGTGLVTCR